MRRRTEAAMRGRRTARRALLGLVCLAVSACEVGGRDPAPVVRDSAGITIVLSSRPAWRRGEAWTVGTEPIVDVGAAGGTAGELRFVRGVVRLDDGGIAVANGGDGTLRFYDAAGQLIRAVGGSDDPVAGLPAIGALERVGDALYVSQRLRQATRVFDLEGRLIDSLLPDSLDASPFVTQFWPLADGSFLLFAPPQGLLPRREAWTENGTFLRGRSGASPQRVLALPAARFVRVPMGVERVALSPVLQFVVRGDRIWAGYPEGYDIGVFDTDGTLQRRIRRTWEPVTVTEARRERVRAVLRAELDAVLREMPEPLIDERFAASLDSLSFAAAFPAHGRLLLDAQGSLWVERTDTMAQATRADLLAVSAQPLSWDVFDSDGRWLGDVELPARFHATAIGDDWIAGVWRDERGRERARVYQLNKPRPPPT